MTPITTPIYVNRDGARAIGPALNIKLGHTNGRYLFFDAHAQLVRFTPTGRDMFGGGLLLIIRKRNGDHLIRYGRNWGYRS